MLGRRAACSSPPEGPGAGARLRNAAWQLNDHIRLSSGMDLLRRQGRTSAFFLQRLRISGGLRGHSADGKPR